MAAPWQAQHEVSIAVLIDDKTPAKLWVVHIRATFRDRVLKEGLIHGALPLGERLGLVGRHLRILNLSRDAPR